jgi:hypothetical protein
VILDAYGQKAVDVSDIGVIQRGEGQIAVNYTG